MGVNHLGEKSSSQGGISAKALRCEYAWRGSKETSATKVRQNIRKSNQRGSVAPDQVGFCKPLHRVSEIEN